ncbi:uncharacterized protein LOC127263141 [Andrographis paniculata]|uniref:uncharacterized protein LOC127263141 n=1 Tax=Andrographis paniculata TaxID=175694 RepID=UPI0021E9A934|nr:uncharacterized protein LOC127263141 [Andrographis paniculata]
MMMMATRFNQTVYMISIIFLIVLMANSINSQARPVIKDTSGKGFALYGNRNEEIVDANKTLAEAETSGSGIRSLISIELAMARKARRRNDQIRNHQKTASKESPLSVEEGEGGGQNWGRNRGGVRLQAKDSFMAFSADYHTARQHPPTNN